MRRALITLLFASSLPGAALAQGGFDLSAEPAPAAAPQTTRGMTGYLRVGTIRDQANSGFAGPYWARDDGNWRPLLDFSLRRYGFGDGGRWFFDGDGHDLFGSRAQGRLAFGEQGIFRISLGAYSLTRAGPTGARTVYQGVGTERLTLPANWAGSPSTAFFTALNQSLTPVALKQTRKHYEASGSMILPRGFSFNLRLASYAQEGLTKGTIAFGAESAFSVASFFPRPVKQETHQMNAALDWRGDQAGLTLGYDLSLFRNLVGAISVQNPFTRSFAFPRPPIETGYPTAFGQMAGPPDNSAQRLALSGWWLLAPKVRATFRLSGGLERQDEPFLPMTSILALQGPTGLPRSSLQGEVRRFDAIGVVTAPLWGFDWRWAASHQVRDNRTAPMTLITIINDGRAQLTAIEAAASANLRRTVPLSFSRSKFETDASTRFGARTRLKLSARAEKYDRSGQAVGHMTELGGRARVSFLALEGLSLSASLEAANRTGSDYQSQRAWIESHSAAYVATNPDQQDSTRDHPLLRKYELADRVRTRARVDGLWQVTPELAFSFGVTRTVEDYRRSLIGLTERISHVGEAGLTFAAGKDLQVALFYTYEEGGARQAGYYLSGNRLDNPAQGWRLSSRDRVHSAGFEISGTLIPGRLQGGVNGDLSFARLAQTVDASPFDAYTRTTPLPDDLARAQRIAAYLDLKVTERLGLRLSQSFARYAASDRALAGDKIDSLSSLLASGEQVPAYRLQVTAVSASVKF